MTKKLQADMGCLEKLALVTKGTFLFPGLGSVALKDSMCKSKMHYDMEKVTN